MNQPRHVLGAGAGLHYGCASRHPTDTDTPRHSTPHPEPPTLSARPRPASQLPRPRAFSVPPTPKPAKRMALRYQPVTEEVMPPITPPLAHATELNLVQDTPSPVQKTGRGRGRGTWRAPQKIAPGVGTHSRSRQAELEKIEVKQAQAACAEWPPSPDTTRDIQRLTRELRLCDLPRDAQKNCKEYFRLWTRTKTRTTSSLQRLDL